ncbi:hypothetical protein [Novosphingobium sp. JCM 18896]|uniref:hypothetical protein n=1 Tax=Novosphingobium sp. JCM 18896 TaxID=2989731 RepID=UPI0022229499|nr:hypothetical protein [Novosphingobium sp. JCM 18896]MCW1430635.1 hypothetical protein [Novosphingobium sp. JCM 18896]
MKNKVIDRGWKSIFGGIMNNFMIAHFGAFMMTALSMNPAQAADDPALPERFKACMRESAFDTTNTRVYVKCNDAAASDYYGRIWLSFSAPELDESYVDSMTRSEKRDFFERVASLFVRRSKSGSLVARIGVSQNGGPSTEIAVIELARFSRSSGGSRGFAINESGAILNSFLGPTFIGSSTVTAVRIDLQFLSLKTNKTAIVDTFFKARDAAAKVALIRSVADIPQEARDALVQVENAIAATYDAQTERPQPIWLTFDRLSANAVRKTVTFLDTAKKQPGFLFVAVSRLPTILTEAPGPGEKLVYGDGRYSSEVANRILNQQVKGKTLREYVREKMPSDYEALATGADPVAFLAAAKALKAVVEGSDLGLNASDQTAAKWAFLAPSALMTNPDVRRAYILAGEEHDGTLKAYGLGLPRIDPPALTSAEKEIVDEGEASADRAHDAEVLANNAAERASLAAAETFQPDIAGKPSLRRTEHRSGLWDYRGEPKVDGATFYGEVAAYRWNSTAAMAAGAASESFTGEKYLGMLSTAGNELRRAGYGKVSFDGDAAKAGIDFYAGEFSSGAISGFGRMVWADGSEYRGRFASGAPTGAGLYKSIDGENYFVEYLSGERRPTAIHLTGNGKQIAGSWAGDTFKAR